MTTLRLRPTLAAILLLAGAGLSADADAQEVVDDHTCQDGPAFTAPLTVEIVGSRTGKAVPIDPERLQVRIDNRGEETVTYDVRVEMFRHGSAGVVRRSDNRLSRGKGIDLSFTLAELGITPSRLESPAQVRVIVEQTTAGGSAGASTTPTLYLNGDGRGSVLLFDEATLIRDFGGGLEVARFPHDPPYSEDHDLVIFGGRADGPAQPGLVPEPIVQSPEQDRICVSWGMLSNAHGAGEDYLNQGQNIPALGVKVEVYQFPNLTSTIRYAGRASGCAYFSIDRSRQVQVTVHAESHMGVFGNIDVKAYESPAHRDVQDTRSWLYYINPPQGDDPIVIDVGASLSSTLMGFGTFSVYRLNQEAWPGLTDDAELDLIHQPEEDNSSAWDDFVNISFKQVENKFVYGHEVGHWYARNWGVDVPYSYDHTSSGNSDCWSGSGWKRHLLRSSEFNSAAYNEGLAQFLSTLVWNHPGGEAGWFRYYKDMSDQLGYDDMIADNYVVDMSAASNGALLGGERNWRDNVCSTYGDDVEAISVELDWSRFYWNVLTTTPVPQGNEDLSEVLAAPKPRLDDLLDHAHQAVQDGTKPLKEPGEPWPQEAYEQMYPFLDDALGDADFRPRWDYFAPRHGVER